MVQMEVSMLSMYIFCSSLSGIHLHATMMTCLSFVVISWASLLSIFSRYREALYILLLGYGNIESTRVVIEWVWEGL